ncbi:hypothetical protein [Thermomonas sp.]|uniref:hypothetical protein n=1 Tax=Thermomonas sp. TaxID=1971895 RepID=UPI0026139B2B|nr:hypothetical protein [Thermomonas sp.]MCO5055127.1 hypothetical protein [Thermomonas sp.]HRO62359.1 hypothetical protein [Thermomonas sp.]
MTRNSKLFSDCLRHPEPLVDPFYCSEQLIIPTAPEAGDNAISRLWREVRDRLTAADVALRDDDDSGFGRHVRELDALLQNEGANFLEFTSFFPAQDVSYSSYRKLDLAERLEFLDTVMRRFIALRHRIYAAHGYTPVSVQVRRDFEKHKSGGASAKRKLEALFEKYGYVKAESLARFQDTPRAYLHAEGTLYAECEAWLRSCGLRFQWRQNHQGKLPDAIFRNGDALKIVECKHMKETGGGQDKQLSELIDLIGHDEPDFSEAGGLQVAYVAFLDGVLFNALRSPRARKMRQQREAIERHLHAHPHNRFVNTWGFRQLLD